MRTRSALLLAGGVGYSLIAASTTPFTLPADVLTGLVVVAMAVLVWPAPPPRRWGRVTPTCPGSCC